MYDTNDEAIPRATTQNMPASMLKKNPEVPHWSLMALNKEMKFNITV